jgi:hypothetical protein
MMNPATSSSKSQDWSDFHNKYGKAHKSNLFLSGISGFIPRGSNHQQRELSPKRLHVVGKKNAGDIRVVRQAVSPRRTRNTISRSQSIG